MRSDENSMLELRKIRLFKGLSDHELRDLASVLRARQFARGEVVFGPTEEDDRLYFLSRGIVKISLVSSGGEERTLDILKPGDTCGGPALLAGPPRMAAAQALTDVTLWVAARERLMALLHRRPGLGLRLIEHLLSQHQRLVSRLDALLHLPPGPRLIAILLDLGERCAQVMGGRYTLPGLLTHRDVAQMAGVHRTTATRWIARYRRRGVLGGRREEISIHAEAARTLLNSAWLQRR